MVENEKNKAKENTYGVYLNFKINKLNKYGIFNYNSNEINNMNIFIKDNSFIVKNEYDIINVYDQQSKIQQNENILFHIRIRGNRSYLEKSDYNFRDNNNLEVNEENIKKINFFIWEIIHSDILTLNNIYTNEEFFLKENDILKFGNVKYIVREIHFKNNKNNDNNKQKEIFNLLPECSQTKKCDICDEEIYRLCKCEDYQHLSCIKKWISKRIIIKENKKKTVKNYLFQILKCNEFIQKDPNCDGECKNCNCIRCNTFFPLKFKVKTENENKIIDIYPISKPANSDYLILESLEFENSGKYLKNIHVIQLNEEDINIGRGSDNDIIIDNQSVSKEQAVIRYYKENENVKLLLKNKSNKFGTLALITKPRIEVNEKNIYLQIDNTLIEAKNMKEEDYLKFKKDDKDNNKM